MRQRRWLEFTQRLVAMAEMFRSGMGLTSEFETTKNSERTIS
jgi:hypothetical protein